MVKKALATAMLIAVMARWDARLHGGPLRVATACAAWIATVLAPLALLPFAQPRWAMPLAAPVCLLFGALISTYLLTKTRFLTELIAGNPRVVDTMPAEIVAEMQAAGSVEPMFDIPFTSFSSFVLLMSSLAMVLAHSAVVRGDYKNTKLWIATTALLGTIFIGGQVYEFTAFYREGLSFTNNLFGSAFFTLTGFHGIHVTVGILMLMALLVVAQQGKLNRIVPRPSNSLACTGTSSTWSGS